MKKKKGFTLVEVLAIIAVLGIIVVLVVPQINGGMNHKKEKEYEKVIDIIENAAQSYHTSNKTNHLIYLSELEEQSYITNDLKNPIDGNKINGCVRVLLDNNGLYKYKYASSCQSVNVPLNVRLNGGTTTQSFNSTYLDGSKITLTNPTRHGYYFSRWEVTQGNSYLIDKNELVIGDTASTLYAMWISWPKLTVNLDGGSISQSFEPTYISGDTIYLKTPTRDLHTFLGWEITEGNGIVSGDKLIMGSNDTTIKAKWLLNTPVNAYKCKNKTVGEAPYVIEYTGNCEVIDDGNYNWRVRFLTNGTLTSFIDLNLNVFMVGAGGYGVCDVMGSYDTWGCGNGGGGYHKVIDYSITVSDNKTYSITIGQPNGGSTSAFDTSIGGGGNGRVVSNNNYGGSGGSTCYEFYESSTGKQYSGVYGSDGSPPANTGMGGNGVSKSYSQIKGGSGIVVIRNERSTPITLNYDNNGGKGCTTKQVSNSFKYRALCEPEREGYHFTGWYTDPEEGTKIFETDVVTYTKDFTLYAHWIDEAGYSRLMTSYKCANVTEGESPYKIEYTGNCQVIDDGDDNWRIRFLTSGDLVFASTVDVDTFLVGAGGYGVCDVMSSYDTWGCGNGGGGYHTVISQSMLKDTIYPITIGQPNGGSTKAFGTTVSGGGNGRVVSNNNYGGSGGSEVYEFYEADMVNKYSGVYGSDGSPAANTGKGGNGVSQSYSQIKGGSGIVVIRNARREAITLNYDNNGGSGCTSKEVRTTFKYKTLCEPTREGYYFTGWYTEREGGEKIISTDTVTQTGDFTLYAHWLDDTGYERLMTSYKCANTTVGSAPYKFEYTGNCQIVDDGDDNWRIKFLSSGDLIFEDSREINAFLVGAGGYGICDVMSSYDTWGCGNGGGGYHKVIDYTLVAGTKYTITIGQPNGGTTSAFDTTAGGGANAYITGSNNYGGSGGSTCYEFYDSSTGTQYSGSYGTDGSPPANTGMGGNGVSQSYSQIKGGSGIVVIRNKR